MGVKRLGVPALVSVLVVWLVSGCAGSDAPAAGGIGDMWGKAYLSTSVTEGGRVRPLVAGTRIRLSFERDGVIGAEAGCNQMSGEATVDGAKLLVKKVAGTEMGCDPQRQAQDEWLVNLLAAGPTWQIVGDELLLSAGDTEIRLRDQRAVEPSRGLVGPRWVVDVLISGKAAASAPKGAEAFLSFAADGKVTGHTGCNSMGGAVQVSADSIIFSNLVATKMACSGDAAALERAVLEVMDGKVGYSVEASVLTITHPGGKGLRLRAQG